MHNGFLRAHQRHVHRFRFFFINLQFKTVNNILLLIIKYVRKVCQRFPDFVSAYFVFLWIMIFFVE